MKHCRYYKHKFPAVDDVVMVKVRSIAEMGAYVSLLEYDNIEGMILLSELSRRRIRSINKLIRVGRDECVVVLRVDEEKGYIDLSKRRVSEEERRKCEEKYNKGKAVNSILRHVAETEDLELEKLYEKTAWKIEEAGGPASSFDAFKLAIGDKPEILDDLGLEPKIRESLVTNIKRRLTPQPVKIRAHIEVQCYQYEGVLAVQAALRAGLAHSTDDQPIKINLIAPPLYFLSTTCLDREQGVKLLEQAIEGIKTVIQEKNGFLTVKMAPKAVTESDEKDLQAMMMRLEDENREVSGDNDNSDEEGAD